MSERWSSNNVTVNMCIALLDAAGRLQKATTESGPVLATSPKLQPDADALARCFRHEPSNSRRLISHCYH